MQLQSRLQVTDRSWMFPLVLVLMSSGLWLAQPSWSIGAMTERAQEKSLPQRIEQADLIFFGSVENVDYGLVKEESDALGVLPYTYVTYRIEQRLKGRSANGDRLTLRFLGGQAPDGRFFEVSNIPQFQVNDRDLLFVDGNPRTDCPLVDCQSGRLRVMNTGVYAADGRPAVKIEKGHLIFDNRVKSSVAPLTLRRLQQAIVEEVARLYTPQQLQAIEPVQSAERGNGGLMPVHPDELPPGFTLPPETGTGSASKEDRLESEAFERNRGNPVLNEK